MPRKSYKPEEIIKLLRVVEIEVGLFSILM